MAQAQSTLQPKTQATVQRAVTSSADQSTEYPELGLGGPQMTLSAARVMNIQRTLGNRAAQRAIAAHRSANGCGCASCLQRQAVQRDTDDEQTPNQSTASAPGSNTPADNAPADNSGGSADHGAQPPGTEPPTFTATAPAVPQEEMQGAFGCDAADPSLAAMPPGTRLLPIQSIVSSSPTVNEDASVVNNAAFAMDKPLNGSQVTVAKTVTSGMAIDRPWGATTPFIGTDELQWKVEDNAITLTSPIKVDIRWGLLSEKNALDIATGNDPQLNKGNIATMIKSLQVTDAGRRASDGDTNAWSSRITTKHELFHVEHLKRLFDQHLPDFQKAVNGKNIPAPWWWWSDDDKKRASFHINAIVTKARDALRDAVREDFDKDGEKLAYADCKNDYVALTGAMEAYGKQQNWL